MGKGLDELRLIDKWVEFADFVLSYTSEASNLTPKSGEVLNEFISRLVVFWCAIFALS